MAAERGSEWVEEGALTEITFYVKGAVPKTFDQ